MKDTQIWKRVYTFRVPVMGNSLKSPRNTRVFAMSKWQESLWDFILVLSSEQNRWTINYRTAIVQLLENIRKFYSQNVRIFGPWVLTCIFLIMVFIIWIIQCFTRIFNPEKSRYDTREKISYFSRVFDIAFCASRSGWWMKGESFTILNPRSFIGIFFRIMAAKTLTNP